jgi:hypothetical protein
MASTASELEIQPVKTEVNQKKEKKSAVMKGTTWVQVRMLLWKNFSLKKRRPISTICELALPLIIVLLLSWLRTLDNLKPKAYEVGKIISFPWNLKLNFL